MADVTIVLLKAHFRQLRLPTMGREFERLARDASSTDQSCSNLLGCSVMTDIFLTSP